MFRDNVLTLEARLPPGSEIDQINRFRATHGYLGKRIKRSNCHSGISLATKWQNTSMTPCPLQENAETMRANLVRLILCEKSNI